MKIIRMIQKVLLAISTVCTILLIIVIGSTSDDTPIGIWLGLVALCLICAGITYLLCDYDILAKPILCFSVCAGAFLYEVFNVRTPKCKKCYKIKRKLAFDSYKRCYRLCQRTYDEYAAEIDDEEVEEWVPIQAK